MRRWTSLWRKRNRFALRIPRTSDADRTRNYGDPSRISGQVQIDSPLAAGVFLKSLPVARCSYVAQVVENATAWLNLRNF